MRFYRQSSFYFNVLILCFVSTLLIMALGYDKVTRLVPLIAMIPAAALSTYCLLGVFFPNLLSRTNVGLIGAGMQRIEADEDAVKTSRLAGNQGLLIITGWLIVFVTLLSLFGFFIAMPIALFVFFKLVGDYSWFKSLVIAVAAEAIIYLAFDVLMEVTLFRGVVFGDLFVL